MKYYLKTPDRNEFIDLEATTELEANLASLPIKASETQKVLGYACFLWNSEAPSTWQKRESYLFKTNEEERFNLENKVISKWV